MEEETLSIVAPGWLLLILFSATAEAEIGQCPETRTYFGKLGFALTSLYKFSSHFSELGSKACGSSCGRSAVSTDYVIFTPHKN